MIRNDFLLQGLDKSCCKGVEVGPWYSPVAPKREGWQSIVIDFKDGSSLINAALGHTDEAIRNLAHQVEDVDIVWKGEQLNILLSDHGVRELVVGLLLKPSIVQSLLNPLKRLGNIT